MKTYSKDEVLRQAEFLEECMIDGVKSEPHTELRWKHQDRIAAMLRAFAELLSEQEKDDEFFEGESE